METKICNNCNDEKPLSEYHKGNGRGGVRTMCKICCNQKYNTPERQQRRNTTRRIKRQDSTNRAQEYEKQRIREEQDPITYMMHSARRRARKRGLAFTITKEDLFLPDVCPLLNIPLQKNRGRMQGNSYSLDRKDSTKGYIPGNVWIISNKANIIKNDATLEELQLLVQNLTDHWEH